MLLSDATDENLILGGTGKNRSAIRDGHDSALADGVERALDRPPTPFEDYVTRTAASDGWG
ncbi:hypothetical protein [Pseudofrankia inefficax]|uniref:hypothetical protein n=1 Tax=Pseudofrankia inefficax (strain DSM 45817 / CECT 9037 / DDB 130130 / EuI1c) TaxID=298654 RepID=UPI0001BFACF7|nr:hypothetical protein [Pseudofrankia inefficax]